MNEITKVKNIPQNIKMGVFAKFKGIGLSPYHRAQFTIEIFPLAGLRPVEVIRYR